MQKPYIYIAVTVLLAGCESMEYPGNREKPTPQLDMSRLQSKRKSAPSENSQPIILNPVDLHTLGNPQPEVVTDSGNSLFKLEAQGPSNDPRVTLRY